jgi:addiction module HigA family antidote
MGLSPNVADLVQSWGVALYLLAINKMVTLNTMKTTLNGLPPIHPGEYIREALEDLGLTQAALAQALGVSAMRISHLVREERPVTAELALRLGQAFGQSPQYWLNLQTDYDLKIAKAAFKDSLRQVRELAVA